MSVWQLEIELLSDTTFGRGDGVPGLVDAEVQHDSNGCPFLAGRTLKGLLREECVNLLYALEQAGRVTPWWAVARRLFGEPGSTEAGRALLHVGDAKLPADLRAAIALQIDQEVLTREQVLDSMTAIRRQTAVDVVSGAPRDETLRALRVILRQTRFGAVLSLEKSGDDVDEDRALGLLAACVKALRLAGSGRNRGVGEIRARLLDPAGNEVTDEHFRTFAEEVRQ